tara:strand:+ start:995 stop:1150 length:156 start_codon:yes stop_codon:yes gene_type:complete
MAANNILKIKTTRGVPRYLYNLDPERYKEDYKRILRIDKAKKKKKKKKRTA